MKLVQQGQVRRGSRARAVHSYSRDLNVRLAYANDEEQT